MPSLPQAYCYDIFSNIFQFSRSKGAIWVPCMCVSASSNFSSSCLKASFHVFMYIQQYVLFHLLGKKKKTQPRDRKIPKKNGLLGVMLFIESRLPRDVWV